MLLQAEEEGIWAKVARRVVEKEEDFWRIDGMTDELSPFIIEIGDEDSSDDEAEVRYTNICIFITNCYYYQKLTLFSNWHIFIRLIISISSI